MLTRLLCRGLIPGLIVASAVLNAVPSLPLARERTSPTDLAVSGRLIGVPAGETRFVRWADLARLPTRKLKLVGEFVPGEQEVTYVLVSDVWAALPRAPGADTLLATCTDGYAGVFRESFVRDYRPMLILEINGRGPDRWPPPGLTFNPGPYVITIAADLAPAVASLLDAGHKRPWGVNAIEVAAYGERFAGALQGRWSALSPRAEAGRELWVHSCSSCHPGPGGAFGGTKGGRPFEAIATRALDPTWFSRYVRDPKGLDPAAKMEPHPHYTDAQLAALIAFVRAESKR